MSQPYKVSLTLHTDFVDQLQKEIMFMTGAQGVFTSYPAGVMQLLALIMTQVQEIDMTRFRQGIDL